MSLQIVREEQGRIAKLLIDHGKGNIFDLGLIAAVHEAVDALAAEREVRCIVLGSSSPNFSFGASVEEHRRAEVGRMLPRFHDLIRSLLQLPVPVFAAVRGRCLGGGLEVALAASRIFAHPSARLGQPEITLGVFAPAASALLPERVGQAEAERLLLTGVTLTAEEALRIRLVDELCADREDPVDAATKHARASLLGLSRSSLRFAFDAIRGAYAERISDRLATLERIYLHELMQTPDAEEGIAAFLEKRRPQWSAGARP